jgi:hypothetical protein
MSQRLAIAADPRAAALAGLDGTFEWGEAVTAAPDALPEHDVAVSLGEVGGDVTWLAGPAADGGGGARTIGTGGDGLWSRAPWPARDDLFELPPPAGPRALVAGGDAAVRGAIAAKLEARGLAVTASEALTADDLAAASAVVLVGEGGDAVPAEAPAVLAARRVLIAPRRPVGFGLLAGTDHLAFGTEDDAVQCADAVTSFPDSFEPFVVLGAIAAERHRASVVYGRLVAELMAERG